MFIVAKCSPTTVCVCVCVLSRRARCIMYTFTRRHSRVGTTACFEAFGCRVLAFRVAVHLCLNAKIGDPVLLRTTGCVFPSRRSGNDHSSRTHIFLALFSSRRDVFAAAVHDDLHLLCLEHLASRALYPSCIKTGVKRHSVPKRCLTRTLPSVIAMIAENSALSRPGRTSGGGNRGYGLAPTSCLRGRP